MIRSFKSRALKRFFERGDERRIRADHREVVRDILARLNASFAPEDMGTCPASSCTGSKASMRASGPSRCGRTGV